MTQEENPSIAEPTLSGSELLVSVDEYKLVHGFAGWYEPPSWEFKNAVISWNELMPVVEKIETVKTETYTHFTMQIGKRLCLIECHEYGKQPGVVYQTPYGTTPASKIESVWLAVVHFITWYNSTIKVNS